MYPGEAPIPLMTVDLRDTVIAKMVENPKVTWWFDTDEEKWHAQHGPSGMTRISAYSRDTALVFLFNALRDRKAVLAHFQALTLTGA